MGLFSRICFAFLCSCSLRAGSLAWAAVLSTLILLQHVRVELETANWESDLTVPNPGCVPVSDVLGKPLVRHRSSSQLPSSCMLLLCAGWEFLVWCNLILMLYLENHWVPSGFSMLCGPLCSLRKYWGFISVLYVVVQVIRAFGKPELPGASPLLGSWF